MTCNARESPARGRYALPYRLEEGDTLNWTWSLKSNDVDFGVSFHPAGTKESSNVPNIQCELSIGGGGGLFDTIINNISRFLALPL